MVGPGGNEVADNRKETRQLEEKGWPPEMVRRRKEFHDSTSHHSFMSPLSR